MFEYIMLLMIFIIYLGIIYATEEWNNTPEKKLEKRRKYVYTDNDPWRVK